MGPLDSLAKISRKFRGPALTFTSAEDARCNAYYIGCNQRRETAVVRVVSNCTKTVQ